MQGTSSSRRTEETFDDEEHHEERDGRAVQRSRWQRRSWRAGIGTARGGGRRTSRPTTRNSQRLSSPHALQSRALAAFRQGTTHTPALGMPSAATSTVPPFPRLVRRHVLRHRRSFLRDDDRRPGRWPREAATERKSRIARRPDPASSLPIGGGQTPPRQHSKRNIAMNELPRRSLLAFAGIIGAAATAQAAGFGKSRSAAGGRGQHIRQSAEPVPIPAPRNQALADQFPSFEDAARDRRRRRRPVLGLVQTMRRSAIQKRRLGARRSRRRISRSPTRSRAVNMRASPPAASVRCHWPPAGPSGRSCWTGTCRITTLDAQGRPSVDDVAPAGDLWYFPAGSARIRCRAMGPTAPEFPARPSDKRQGVPSSNTLMLSDWLAHHAAGRARAQFRGRRRRLRQDPARQSLDFSRAAVPGSLGADRAASGLVRRPPRR